MNLGITVKFVPDSNLVKNGNSSQRQQAHRLQGILQSGLAKNNEQGSNKISYVPWIIGGVAVISLALVVGYLWGKKKKSFNF